MAVYTNTLRYTGLSGVDTDSMVNSLMKAEGMKLDKLKKNKQLLEWKQAAYRSVSSSLIAFRDTWMDIAKAGNARTKSSFINNTARVSTSAGADSSAVKFSTTNSTKAGNYTMQVKQLASNDVYGGSAVRGTVESTEIDPSKIKKDDKISFTLDGTTKTVSFTQADITAIDAGSANEMENLKSLLNTKLTAAFGYDTINGQKVAKAQVSLSGSKLTFTTTSGHTLKVAEGGSRDTAQLASDKITDSNGKILASAVGQYTLDINGKDVSFELKADMSGSDVANTINTALRSKEINNLSASVSADGKITFKASGTREDIGISISTTTGLANLGFGSSSVNVGRTSMLASFGLESGATTVLNTNSSLKDALNVTEDGSFFINGVEIQYTKDESIKSLMDKFNKSGAGVSLSYNAISESFTLESKETGKINEIQFVKPDGSSANTSFLTDKLKLNIKPSGTVNITGNPVNANITDLDTNKLSDLGVTGSGGTIKINSIDISYTSDTTIQGFINAVNGSGAGTTGAILSYDSTSKKFTLSGEITEFEDTGDIFKSKLGLDTRISKAQDAEFTLNGKTFTRDKNTNIEVGDLKFTLNATTEIYQSGQATGSYDTLNVNIGKDTSKTLDYIKSFVEAYNALISGLNKTTTTNRAKSGTYTYYEPLTDEEKSAMTESQITAWEEKAKQGLLYNDELVNRVSSSMRSMLYQSVKLGDGRNMGLYEIGITTSSNYWEGGKLVIDEDKLMKAIEERGDDIAEMFTKSASKGYVSGKNNSERLQQEGLSDRLYDIIQMAVDLNGSIAKKAGVSGGYTEFDNAITKQLKQENTRISEMLKYLQNKETYYFSMFSKMEQAVNNANSQMSYLQSQLGG